MNGKLNWLAARLRDAQRIRGYSPSYNPGDVAEQLGIDEGELVKLDANENFFIPRAFLSQILRELTEEIDPRLYPQREAATLIQALEAYLGLPSECIVLGNSSDELIETTARVFLKAGEEAVSISPTFVMYRIIVNNQGNEFKDVFLKDDLSLDVAGLLSEASRKTILCFLCSPNNPTGNQFKIESIGEILENFRGIIIVDEAYAEFASYSVKDMVDEYENLIVLRTFSKAFGLAGLRIGYALACPSLASALRRIQLPFNINKVSLQMATKLLDNWEVVEAAVKGLKAERERFTENLNDIPGMKAFPSSANFILVKTGNNVDIVLNGLMHQGILVRDIGKILDLGRCLRITVGLPEMNEKLLNTLTEIRGGEAVER